MTLSDSVGGLTLRELLRTLPAQIENHQGQKFLCTAEVERLLSYNTICAWMETHRLHRRSDIGAHDHDTIGRILDNCRLLFAILVAAELECLTFALVSSGQSDDSLPHIDYSCLDLHYDERRRLDAQCHKFAPILRKGTHLHISEETVLPFTRRESIDKRGSFGQIFRVEIAEGHLEGYDKVRHSALRDSQLANGTQTTVAEKVIRLDKPEDERFYLREVETLREREHPNIVPLLASYTLEATESEFAISSLHLLFPLAEKDLFEWMACAQPPAWLRDLPQPDRKAYLFRSIYSLVSGLAFLHHEKNGKITAHHDLKPRNILVFAQELKFADFGRSQLRPLARGSETEASSGLGTYEYHPPEYWNDDGSRAKVKHGRAFDIWAMGCIIIELATLIVHGWSTEKVAEFRDRRRSNPNKTKTRLASQHTPDGSFHNNWIVVENWIHELQKEDKDEKLRSTLRVALQMMKKQENGCRLYAWEAQLNLYKVYYSATDQNAGLEKETPCVRSPPRGKALKPTQTPLHRAAQDRDLERFEHLVKAGWRLINRDHTGLTVRDVLNLTQRTYHRENLGARLAPKTPQATNKNLALKTSKASNGNPGSNLLQATESSGRKMARHLPAQPLDAISFNDDHRSLTYKAVTHDETLKHPHVAGFLSGEELVQQKDNQWRSKSRNKATLLSHTITIEQPFERSNNIKDQQTQPGTVLQIVVGPDRKQNFNAVLNLTSAKASRQGDSRVTILYPEANKDGARALKLLYEALGSDGRPASLHAAHQRLRDEGLDLWLRNLCQILQQTLAIMAMIWLLYILDPIQLLSLSILAFNRTLVYLLPRSP
ncbi:MAG: hypothetical protein Q9191_004543 [Dirinaria sp. TL-2023a]